MTETEWERVGRLARNRRERLGLGQGELKDYGGPGVVTVRKLERATQPNFPSRTRRAMERALGWKVGEIDRLLRIHEEPWWADEQMRAEFETELIEENLPDLTPAPAVRRAAHLTDDELLAELTYRMKRYAEAIGDDGSEVDMLTSNRATLVPPGPSKEESETHARDERRTDRP